MKLVRVALKMSGTGSPDKRGSQKLILADFDFDLRTLFFEDNLLT